MPRRAGGRRVRCGCGSASRATPSENGSLDGNERFGFRLRNGAIELQLGDGNWQALTDPATLTVTAFEVAPRTEEPSLERFCAGPCAAGSTTCPPRQQVRSFAVAIDAQAVADPRRAPQRPRGCTPAQWRRSSAAARPECAATVTTDCTAASVAPRRSSSRCCSCFAMLIIVAVANRNAIVEARASANQYRSTQSFEAAEAGLEWALARLNDSTPIGDDCLPSADPAATSFRARYLRDDGAGFVAATWDDAGTPVPLQAACVRGEERLVVQLSGERRRRRRRSAKEPPPRRASPSGSPTARGPESSAPSPPAAPAAARPAPATSTQATKRLPGSRSRSAWSRGCAPRRWRR